MIYNKFNKYDFVTLQNIIANLLNCNINEVELLLKMNEWFLSHGLSFKTIREKIEKNETNLNFKKLYKCGFGTLFHKWEKEKNLNLRLYFDYTYNEDDNILIIYDEQLNNDFKNWL